MKVTSLKAILSICAMLITTFTLSGCGGESNDATNYPTGVANQNIEDTTSGIEDKSEASTPPDADQNSEALDELAVINKSAKWHDAIPISHESDNIGIHKNAIILDIGSGKGGQTHTIWNEYSSGRWHIMQNKYAPGVGWDSPFHIDTESDDAKLPLLSVNEQGNAVSIWREGASTWSKQFNVDSGWGDAEAVGDDTPGVGSLSINKLGEIFWVYQQWDGDSFAIFSKRLSPENGWGLAERIDDETQGSAVSPSLVVAPSGNAFVAWNQYDGDIKDANTRSNVWANIYNKNNGWSGAKLIETQNDGHASDVRVAIDDDENAIVSWTQLDGPSYLPATTRSSIFINSFNVSKGWNGEKKISDENDLDAHTSTVSLNGSGNGIVVWNEYQWDGATPATIKAKTVASLSLAQDSHNISTGDLWDIYSAHMKKGTTPMVAVDPTGKGVVVWRGVGSIFAATYYPDDGWQPPELIGTGGFILYQPKVSIDAYGRANATWVQQINDHVNPTSYRIWANRMD